MIRLRPTSTFSGNGVLRGTIVAFDENDEPLGWEQHGNWSSSNFRQKAAQDLATVADINEDRARTLISKVVQEARREADGSSEQQPPPEIKVSARLPELVDIVAGSAGKSIRKRYDLTKPQGVRGRNSDNTRLRQVLQWEPTTSLEEGLEETYRWIQGELAKRGRVRKDVSRVL